jgi:Sec-independent protein translocase protein TatA
MSINAMLICAFFGDIGGGELFVVFAAMLLLFGGKQLPSMARTMSRTIEKLRKASEDFKSQLMATDTDLGDVTSGREDIVGDTDEGVAPDRAPAPPPSPGASNPAATPAQKEEDPTPRDLAG